MVTGLGISHAGIEYVRVFPFNRSFMSVPTRVQFYRRNGIHERAENMFYLFLFALGMRDFFSDATSLT